MKLFYKQLYQANQNRRHYYRFFKYGKEMLSAWYERHSKIFKRTGSGGKNHLLEKGHVQWNRKGRW